MSNQSPEIAELQKRLDAAELALAIERSPYVRRNCPAPQMATAILAEFFKRDGQGFTARGLHGECLYSSTRFGSTSNVDEAVQQILKVHPHRDFLLGKQQPQADAASQMPSQPAQRNLPAGTITRAQLDHMRPVDRAAHFKNGGQIVD